MLNTKLPLIRSHVIVRPFCEDRNRIGVHSHQQRRYIYHACNKTSTETAGTPFYGLKFQAWIVTLVLALLAGGCPLKRLSSSLRSMNAPSPIGKSKPGSMPNQVWNTWFAKAGGPGQADGLYVKVQGAEV